MSYIRIGLSIAALSKWISVVFSSVKEKQYDMSSDKMSAGDLFNSFCARSFCLKHIYVTS